MNILKNMEAVFLTAAVLAVSASQFGGPISEAQARAYTPDAAAIATSGKVAVVNVTAKRLSAEEKAELLADAAGSRG